MKTKLLLLLLFNFSFLIFNCEAATRFVSKTGTATPPYTTWATASDSIQKCINICNNGDTIYVANGVYKETLAITKRIALLGMSKDSTVIDGTGLNGLIDTLVTIYTKANWVIKNFHLIGRSIEGVTKLFRGDYFLVQVKNCIAENADDLFIIGDRSSTIDGVIAKNFRHQFVFWTCINDTNTPVIENCLAYQNRNSNSIVVLDYGGNPIFRNNIFCNNINDNYGVGINQWGMINSIRLENNLFYGCTGYSSSSTSVVDSIIIINNTSIKNRRVGQAFWLSRGDRTRIRNNIMADNNEALYIYYSQANTDYNIYWNNNDNTGGHGNLGVHDKTADPMFVKDTIPYAGSGDFHLQQYSPAIDAGDPTILDVDGSRSDIGFYGGPYGEEYKYQDLAPQPPKGLNAVVDSGLIKLKWKKNTEADFKYYKLFRDTIPSFTADSVSFVSVFTDTFYNQIIPHKVTKYYYKLTAVDSQGNESRLCGEIGVLLTSVGEGNAQIIQDYLLYQSYPNPFNSSTVIPFRLKDDGFVRINIYDIKGEMVGCLYSGDQSAGYHEVFFTPGKVDGKDNIGIASGIYLYSIEVIGKGSIPVFSDMKKMIYLK